MLALRLERSSPVTEHRALLLADRAKRYVTRAKLAAAVVVVKWNHIVVWHVLRRLRLKGVG